MQLSSKAALACLVFGFLSVWASSKTVLPQRCLNSAEVSCLLASAVSVE